MLQAMSAPAHSDMHPHLKIQAQKLMNSVQVTANETANDDSLPGSDTRVSQKLDHVFHQPQSAVAVERQDGLGMELHGLHGQVAMAHAHDDAVFGLGGDFKAGRQLFTDRI